MSKRTLEARKKRTTDSASLTPAEVVPPPPDSPPSRRRYTLSAFKCPDCDETFRYNQTLGRHRRFTHGVISARTLEDQERRKRQNKLAMQPPQDEGIPNSNGKLSRSTNGHSNAASNGHEVPALEPIAYAILVGEVLQSRRHTAEEHGIPTRQFTRQFGELFFRQTRG